MSVFVLDSWVRVHGVIRDRIKVLQNLLNREKQEQQEDPLIGLVWEQCAVLMEGLIDVQPVTQSSF